jgi:hypothetical protein
MREGVRGRARAGPVLGSALATKFENYTVLTHSNRCQSECDHGMLPNGSTVAGATSSAWTVWKVVIIPVQQLPLRCSSGSTTIIFRF